MARLVQDILQAAARMNMSLAPSERFAGMEAAAGTLVHEIARLEASQAPQWQPVETAGKGHDVLVWNGRDRIVAHWAEHVEDHPPITPGWYYWNGRMFDLVRPAPLLWMELPDKPDAALPTNRRLDSTQKCRKCGRTGAEHRRDGGCLEALSSTSEAPR